MIQQQKAGRSLPAEFRHIVSTYGILKPMKGLSATVMRESLYASGYLAVAPMLRGVLQQQPAVANLPGGPLILSGIAAGLLATVCTQPADTIKTRMQASPLCLLLLLVWLACRICRLHAWLKWQVPSLSRMRLRVAAPSLMPCSPPCPACSSRLCAPLVQAFPDAATHPEYRSLLSTTQHIVRTEGVGTLFAGLGPRSVRIVAAGK